MANDPSNFSSSSWSAKAGRVGASRWACCTRMETCSSWAVAFRKSTSTHGSLTACIHVDPDSDDKFNEAGTRKRYIHFLAEGRK